MAAPACVAAHGHGRAQATRNRHVPSFEESLIDAAELSSALDSKGIALRVEVNLVHEGQINNELDGSVVDEIGITVAAAADSDPLNAREMRGFGQRA